MNSPGKLSWSLSGICSGSSGFLSVLCEIFVIFQGSVFLFWTVEPFTTRPVSGLYLPVPLFFFLSGLFVDAVCSLSLSFRRWGTPNLFGLGFPLCFFILTRSSPSIRTSSPTPTPRSRSRSCFFFSCRRSRWAVEVFGSRGGVLVRSVFWCGVLVGPGCSSLFSCVLASLLALGQQRCRYSGRNGA